MKKRIVVACPGAVATSTLAAEAIRELCEENGIEAEISQVRLSELAGYAKSADLVCTTAKIPEDLGNVPVLHVMAFVSGIGEAALKAKIIDILKKA